MTLFDPGVPEPAPKLLDLTVSATPATRLRLTVAYDGAPFAGFAVNHGVRTVAGDLNEALAKVLGHPVTVVCAGRTDRGVHAVGQVVSLDTTADVASAEARAGIERRVNHLLAPSIAVRDATVEAPDFDARFSARSRRYRYLILNRPTPDPFRTTTAWHIERPLDLPAMVLAADPFIGQHDFTSFCRMPKGRNEAPTLVRRVMDAAWHDDGDGLLRFEIEASAFCHQMVRSIVGTLVWVGTGRLSAGEIMGIIRSQNRQNSGDLAPAKGLTLLSVRYDTWQT